jgi:hypothetical protein
MAIHEKIDLSLKPLYTYVCSSKHGTNAVEAARFLNNFDVIEAVLTQYPKNEPYTCWYLTFKNYRQPFILNVNIRPTYFQIEFRYPQFLPDTAIGLIPNKEWKRANSNKYSVRELDAFLEGYLEKIRSAFYSGKLKYRDYYKRIGSILRKFTVRKPSK